jgi:hypothetical protein
MRHKEENRVKQVAGAAGICLTIALIVLVLVLGWRSLPGVWGEWLGTIAGFITTPIFLEVSFAILGIVIVMTLNHFRQKKDGDELVYLDQVEGPDLPNDLPARSRFAVYEKTPLDGETPTLLEQAEGAWLIGDGDAATQYLAEMSDEELSQKRTLEIRLELARASGRTELASRLEKEIAARP